MLVADLKQNREQSSHTTIPRSSYPNKKVISEKSASITQKGLMRLPNEILYNIVDELILASLDEDPEIYDANDRIEILQNEASGGGSISPQLKRVLIGLYPRRRDYGWKQLWLDLGLARSNNFFRSVTWPRLDKCLADLAKEHYEKLIRLIRADGPILTQTRRSQISALERKLEQEPTSWPLIQHYFIGQRSLFDGVDTASRMERIKLND